MARNKDKPKPEYERGFCMHSWRDNVNDRVHPRHQCLLIENHREKHKCICGVTQ